MLNIYDIELNSQIYGPGHRMVIWVQGCLLRCNGCWNQNMWSLDQNKIYESDELFQMAMNENEIEGITLIGGEPMHQSAELLPFCKKIKKAELSIVLFTGYEIEELTNEIEKELLELCDIIICGRYIEEKRNIYLQWRGSYNQRIIFNSERYINFQIEDANYCEIEIDRYGRLIISGFPETEFIHS